MVRSWQIAEETSETIERPFLLTGYYAPGPVDVRFQSGSIIFQDWLSGPDVPPSINGCVDLFDYEEDGDVDLQEFASLQEVSTGLSL